MEPTPVLSLELVDEMLEVTLQTSCFDASRFSLFI